MCRAILENIIPAFISFLIGPWSDKFGRKPVLLSTSLGKWYISSHRECSFDTQYRPPVSAIQNLFSIFTGYFLVYFILTIVSILSLKTEISPWYYLLAFVPLSVLGGMCGLITGIFCYITDVSSQNDRAFRYYIKIDQLFLFFVSYKYKAFMQGSSLFSALIESLEWKP